MNSTGSGSKDESKLLSRLFAELCQTEQSAYQHPRIEAQRLGDVPPARAMLAVSQHAELALGELKQLAQAESLPIQAAVGRRIGMLFSMLRKALDFMLDREKSYRATLLGMHHGVDLVILVAAAARADERWELARWCERWLTARRPLVDSVASDLSWFATHPRDALDSARHTRREINPSA